LVAASKRQREVRALSQLLIAHEMLEWCTDARGALFRRSLGAFELTSGLPSLSKASLHIAKRCSKGASARFDEYACVKTGSTHTAS